jgi:hypothetical protein
MTPGIGANSAGRLLVQELPLCAAPKRDLDGARTFCLCLLGELRQ